MLICLKVIIGGAEEELSLQRLMDDVNQGIQEELAAVPDGTVAEEDVERMVHERMASKSWYFLDKFLTDSFI